MKHSTLITKSISLESLRIPKDKIRYQLSPEELERITLDKGMGQLASSEALAIRTGKFTGRSPKDRFIVKDSITKDKVWWGDVNLAFDPEKFDSLYEKMLDYIERELDEVYVRDCFACAAKDYKTSVRVINEYPWSNLFAYNMFIRPTMDELELFQEDWTVLNLPGFLANPSVDGTRQENFAILNFTKKIAIIGGTGYTGEIKKGIFSALNFELPTFKNTLAMHCSANVGEQGDTAIFFGLSGTGKTTLSADPKRKLIGDDEHGWSSKDEIFNFEGGCYAKAIDLDPVKEPDIYGAIKKGALLENVIMNENGEVDFTDVSLTQNTRVSYPIDHIQNIQVPSVGSNPKNIFFLTADAFGVLPPISKLSPEQAAYHFISGYTAKVAGTEAGVEEPMPSFSACFGAPFMPLHPAKYAKMLSEKMQASKVNVWLVNTGWTGGPYGIGHRMSLKYTRAMINAALEGNLERVSLAEHPIFGLHMPTSCPGVPNELLNPINTWGNKKAYTNKAKELAYSFKKNFKLFENECDTSILSGGPKT
ncbi:MAG: phosphoenolpyruvate carboxykinase (ATP) [Flavobacteriaceae bacterium]